ncbi:MAG TPA: YdcF family protein [Rhodanobacteraceae bacterium]|nr:YdcF family protein [Rhodanobacteraceae bacterium]
MHVMDYVNVFLSPLGFGLLLAIVLWFRRGRMSRAARRAGIAVLIVCYVFMTPFGSNFLTAWQEHRAPPASACAAPEPQVIVLLSGGLRRDAVDGRDFGVLNAASLQRTLVAAELARRTPGAQLVIAGGGRNGMGVAQSTVMAGIAQNLGVPAEAIRSEMASTTTWENATLVHSMQPALPARIWLVTSASHMARALIAFRAVGFDPCSYPGDSRAAPFDGPADFLPTAGAIANTDAIVHEWVGELVYRVRAAF